MKLTDPVEVVLPYNPNAILREISPRSGISSQTGKHVAIAPPPYTGIDLRPLHVRPPDQALAVGVAVAVPLSIRCGAVAVHAVRGVDVSCAYIVPLGTGGVVEAVVIVELGRVANVRGHEDGPVVWTATFCLLFEDGERNVCVREIEVLG